MNSSPSSNLNPLKRLVPTLLFLTPALIFGSWACLLFRLNLAQELVNLQSPRFHNYTLTAAAFLLLFALLFPLLFSPNPSRPPFAWGKMLASILVLLLPLGAYLMLPPAFTTPAALLDRAWASATTKAAGVSGAGRVDPAVVRSFILNSDPQASLSLSPVDLQIVQREPELQEVLKKRRVELLGQWLPLEKSRPNEFRLVRLVMVCCAADARPVGILTQGEIEGAQPGDWFRATGTLNFEDPRETVIFKADTVDPVEAPEEIFLY